MNMLDWDESYSVGQEKIDEQHRILMRLINRLNNFLITSYIKDDNIELSNLVETLYEYSIKHFTYEELYMRDIRYPKIEQHTEIHEDIKNQINHYYIKITNGTMIVDTTITLKFSILLKEHILNEDLQYSQFARKTIPKDHSGKQNHSSQTAQ